MANSGDNSVDNLDTSNGSYNSAAQVDRILNRLQNCVKGGNPKTSSGSEFTKRNLRNIRNQSKKQKDNRRRGSIGYHSPDFLDNNNLFQPR
jgi:hypothetical protein